MLRAAGLAHRFTRRTLFEDVNITLFPGEAVLLRGRSGSGKTTMLHVLAGIASPTAGQVVLAGQDLAALDPAARARLRLREVGFVFQHFNLVPDLTAEENVRLPMDLAGAKGRRGRAVELLAEVGLQERAHSFPGSLSGGEMQRVAIARALANDPRLILADEPTANLDEANARMVLGLLAGLGEQGRAVLVASHDALALPFFPRRAELQGGALRFTQPEKQD